MKTLFVALVLITASSFGFAQTKSKSETILKFWIAPWSIADEDSPTAEANPLTLLVEIGKNGSIKLNSQNAGQINNPTLLTTKIKSILQQRKKQGVFREGSNDVEATVSFRVDRTVSYEDFVSLISKLWKIGVVPITVVTDKTGVPQIPTPKKPNKRKSEMSISLVESLQQGFPVAIYDEWEYSPTAGKLLTIYISDNGEFTIGKERVAKNSMSKYIAEQMKGEANGFLLIKPSSKVTFGSIEDLLNIIATDEVQKAIEASEQ